MRKDPWTDPDPQPGDFDGELSTIGARYIEAHAADPDTKLRILVSVVGAEQLERRVARDEQAVSRDGRRCVEAPSVDTWTHERHNCGHEY